MNPIPELCTAEAASFWPWFSSPALAAWPGRERTLVVVPIAGLADWGLGHALDAEETVAMAVLREAVRRRPADGRLLVLSPLRFVFGSDPGCAFAVDPPVAHALIAEVAASVAASGFGRVLLFNASPWNEELAAAASRDLCLAHGLQIFRINLAAVELDFHPIRSRNRRCLQTLLTALTGREPGPPSAAPSAVVPPSGTKVETKEETEGAWSNESVTPLPLPFTPLAEARVEGADLLQKAGARLAALLGEIDRQP